MAHPVNAMPNPTNKSSTATTIPPNLASSASTATGPALFTTAGGLLLVLALSVFAIAPLFYPGYFQAHSGFAPLWNIADLRANLGQPAWTPHLAVDFDSLRGDGLLPYYLAALLPVAPAVAVKLIIGFGWLLGGAGMFLWLKSWLGHAGAALAALVYVYLPGQITAAYVRGAWAETLFWGLLPVALLAATYLVTSPRWRLLPPAALVWLALGLTQLGLTVWALLFVAVLLLVVHPRRAVLPLLAALAGVTAALLVYGLLLGWPLAPATAPADHLLYPAQLVSAYWGVGPSRPGWNDGLSLQLGVAAVGLAMITAALWWRGDSARQRDRRLWFFLLAALVLALLTTGLFEFFWRWPLPARLLTYPWQLLGLAGLALAVLAGALPWLEPQFARLPLLAGLLLMVLVSTYPRLEPRFIKFEAIPPGPQAELGRHQLALLNHRFAVASSGFTVGLGQTESAIPLEAHGPLRPGDSLQVTAIWQPLATFEQDYKIFAHLVDAAGNVLAQFDGYPQNGAYPTSTWSPGELIEDTYTVTVPAAAPPGPYRLYIGLYNEATQERLPVAGDSAGRVILDVN